MRSAHEADISGAIFAIDGNACFPPDISLISACYRPVILPVLLLPPRLGVSSKRLEIKVFLRPTGQNRAILPPFLAVLNEKGPALPLALMAA
jgi:hypothetical protein